MKKKRLELAEIEEADIEFIFSALSDSQLTRYYGVHFSTIEAAKEQMEFYKMLKETKSGIWWKCQDMKSKKWVGASGFNDWDHNLSTAEIGCWVLPQFWGNGYGSEIIQETIRSGFEEMSLNSIEGFVDSENETIKKVLKKFNFEHLNSNLETDSKTGKQISIDHFQLKNN